MINENDRCGNGKRDMKSIDNDLDKCNFAKYTTI